MSKTITLNALDARSIERAIRELEDYKEWVAQKTELLCRKCADLGFTVASANFSGAFYGMGNNDVSVTLEPTNKGFKILASGESVCFIEFGAGVYYNGVEPYPMERPAGVVGIGEFGAGHGKQDGWFYTDENGEKQYTHGNPAAMPMYNAQKTIREMLTQIAKEVFAE